MATIEHASPIPDRVGRWRLERLLGEGGFGAAWLARGPLGRIAVVKLLSEPPGDEMRALAKIHHPAVVEALEAGSEPVPHLVMGFAPGHPLSTVIDTIETGLALRILAVLSDALAACHAAGVAHGDVKPANVMIDPGTGQLTLIDFGLAGGAGGTPRYAAPERPGAQASAPADVYAMGLIAWELFVHQLPWPDDAFADRFGPDVPRLPVGPEWLGDLLVEVLDPDPAKRPTAAAIADACEANGLALAAPTADAVARRARTMWVDRPRVDPAVAMWIDRGGALAITGPGGSGRSHALSGVAKELQARGTPFVAMYAGGGPWRAIEAALEDPSLPGPAVPLPQAADPLTRADAAAEALVARAGSPGGDPGQLVVLVDDWESLDEGTHACVEALLRLEAAVLIAADRLPDRVAGVALQPLDPPHIAQLLTGLIGSVDPAVVRSVARVSRGLPRDIVDYTVAAVSSGALVWRRRSWVVDTEALESLEASWVCGSLPSTASLSHRARRLGAIVALAQPIDRDEAMGIAGAEDLDLDALVGAGLVRDGHRLQCASTAATSALRQAVSDLQPVGRSLRDGWLARDPVPWARLGPILPVAGDRDCIEVNGARCVSALAQRDVDQAVALAEELWALTPSPSLAIVRIDLLVRAGRVEEARNAGRAYLGDRRLDEDDVPILIALATAEGVANDPVAGLQWIQRAVSAMDDRPLGNALRLARAQARFDAGEHEEAEADCRAICALTPERDQIRTWLSAIRLLSQARARKDGARAGLAVLENIPEGLGDQTVERALVEGNRGRLLWHTGQPRAAAKAMEVAATFRRALPLVDRGRLENNAGLCWYSVGDVSKAVACWERALLSFERIGALLDAVYSRVNLCQGYRDLGRWQRAEVTGQEAITTAREQRIVALEAMALGNLGDVMLWQRKFARAADLYDQAARIAVGDAFAEERVEIARRRAELAALRWDADAEARVMEACRLASAHDASSELGLCLAIGAMVLARSERHQEAGDRIHRSLEVLKKVGAPGSLAIARLWIGEAYLTLGQLPPAIAEAEAVVRYAEEFVRPPLRRWADRILSRARPNRSTSDVERLTQIAVRVAMHHDLDEIFDDLAAAAVELVDADRALVILMQDGAPTIAAQAGLGLERAPSGSIIERVLSTGREIVVTDLGERADLRDNRSVVAMRLRAAMCMPLTVNGEPLGALYLDSRGSPGGELNESAVLVRALAAHASVALHKAHLTTEIRQQAEDAERARLFADVLLRSVPTPVVVAAEDGAIQDANDAAVALLRNDTTASMPSRLDTCLHPLTGGMQGEYMLRTQVKRRGVPVFVHRSEVRAPDGAVRLLYALTDLSPRIAAEAMHIQAMEAARESNAAKSRFLAMMSHELRTPMNAILGYSELILEDTDDPQTTRDLGRILSAGHHLLGLIDDVLDISQIEADRLELSFEDQPLDDLIAEVIALTRPLALEGGVQFELEVPAELGRALTDHRRVRQVCINLLTNAIRHADGTIVTLAIVASADQVAVEVADDGIGIPEEFQEILFEPFVRLDPTNSPGTGLGLAISHRLAIQLGGALTMRSTLGQGSTFCFVFPRCAPGS